MAPKQAALAKRSLLGMELSNRARSIRSVAFVSLMVLASCIGARAPNLAAPAEQPPDVYPGRLADGLPCLQPTECAGGVCAGRGCSDDEPGRCMRYGALTCDEPARAFCGCGGQMIMTLERKGACSTQRYRYVGACRPGDRGRILGGNDDEALRIEYY